MKRLFLIAVVVCMAVRMNAQTPSAATQPGAGSQAVAATPAAYSASTPVNFVRSYDVLVPTTAVAPTSDIAYVIATNRSISEVKQTTGYFDGLGRPMQTVAKAQSPAGYDMVSPVVYDGFGREVYKYMPYISTGSTGDFKQNPFAEQNTMLKNYYNPGNDPAGEQYFSGKTDYEASSLNRVTKTYAPGNNWVGDATGIGVQYLNNTQTEQVRVWDIGIANGSMPATGSVYANGKLGKMVTTDEKGMKVIEYKDKKGLTILKKVQLGTTPSIQHNGWLCTYYVYDDIGRLRFVIPPKATDWLESNSWAFESTAWSSSTVGKELCFSYEYDDEGRMIVKRVPGAGEVYMVYDARDRMIMMQDENMRNPPSGGQGGWMVSVYDALNRPTQTGLLTDNNTRAYHQAAAQNSTTYPVTTGTNFELLTETYYDDYTDISSNGSTLRTTLITTNINNTDYFYTPDNTTFPYPQAITASYQVRNMVTGTKTKVIGTTSTFLYSVNFYDDRGRPIQTQSRNYSGAKDTVTTQYSFSGQVLRTLVAHKKNAPNMQAYRTGTKNEYDAGGRLIKTSKKTGTDPEVVNAEHVYDELGKLKQKKIGRKRNDTDPAQYTTTALDVLNYDYNIRGWMKGINKDYARGTAPSLTAGMWFGMEMSYDFGFANTELNGNIAGIRWRSGSDGEQRAYGFTYDNANRLKTANFTQLTGSVWDVSKGIDYSLTSMTYDLNGNITALDQNGLNLNTSSPIDDLVYNYYATSNKLRYVKDNLNNAQSTLGDFKEQTGGQTNTTAVPDYDYDLNGNLKYDKNKDISSITYNHLNLPAVITVTGKGTITYTYDAGGNKLRKVTVDNTVSPSKTTTTDYYGLFTYEDNALQFIATEEGRARAIAINSNATWAYDYMEKDYLGNVRVMITDELKTDPYPNASLETASLTNEQLYYSNTTAGRVNKGIVSGYPTDTYTNPNDFVQRLSGASGGSKIGTGIFLKVMAGDKINIRANNWYRLNGNTPGTAVSPITDIVAALAAGIPGVSSNKVLQSQLTSTLLSPSANSFINNRNSTATSGKPSAWLHMMVFDEQMNLINPGDGTNSYFEQVGPENTSTVNTFVVNGREVTRSGYVYIYVSNETPNIEVFFDNLQVTHIRSALLETNDYTPWGLVMKGVSSRALSFGGAENKYNFLDREKQSNEFSDGSGLELYDLSARFYDAQIARFGQTDPLVEYMRRWSPYTYGFNNPVRFADPSGLAGGDSTNKPNPDDALVNPDGTERVDVLPEVSVTTTSKQSNTGSGWLHTTLDIIGIFDPFGIADGANALIYLAEGDYKNATLSAVGMLPFGDAVKALKYADEAVEVVEDVVKYEDEVVEIAEKNLVENAKIPCGCFLAGTIILTDSGYKRIEQIEIGDKVWAYNDTTHRFALKEVVRIFEHTRDTIYRLQIGGELINTTSDHPFFIGGRWLQVKNLHIGDSVTSYAGKKIAISAIDIVIQNITVHNFEVADYHTYYVSTQQILVHNNGPCDLPTVKQGTPGWDNAKSDLSISKGKANARVETATDAKKLLTETKGKMNRYKNYTKKTYKKGYEVHNVKNAREASVGNTLQHIKWKDGKASGHIFYNKPN